MCQLRIQLALISLILILSALFSPFATARTTKQDSSHLQVIQDRIIQSLKNLVDYYRENTKSLKYVGYMGLLKGKDYLRETLECAKDGSSTLTTRQINQIKHIYNNFLTLLSCFESRNNSPGYHNLWNVLSISDPLPKALRNLELTLNDDNSNSENLLPFLTSKFTNVSRSCLNDIMGIGKPNISMCTFNDICWKGISNTHTSYDGAIQQLLAIFIGQKLNCTKKMNILAQQLGGIEQVKHDLCSKVYYHIQHEYIDDISKVENWDLFLEQIYLCGGLTGYQQFIDPDYLSIIQNWQNHKGCSIPYQGIYSLLLSRSHHTNVDRISLPTGISPNILMDDTIQECQQRRSAIASKVLSMYLRWFSVKKEFFPIIVPTNSTELVINGTSDAPVSIGLGIFGAVWLGTALVVIFILVLLTHYCKPAVKKDYDYQEVATTDRDQKTDRNQ